ncbi:MAG: tRNA pseudouridine(55) synthase TruB [Nitriliruptoraceae bacterium]|nr:tRNA pseudouridine(55) synthase TruB [Nitriliruptoraceae bacterium]
MDKPVGHTSHDAVARVRRAFGQHRVGHTGTLDPSATGVLVVCLGRATKLVQYLQAGSKTYAATMRLGITTTSQDADGEILAQVDASAIDERRFCEALTRFHGPIEQIPPMVSAVKVDGERLHAKARRGETVAREPRHVTVHDLVLDAFEPGEHPEASFLVTCSAGTYVRTIAHDVGEALGVGGSLSGLRRLANGPFTADQAVDLDTLEQAGADGRLGELLIEPGEAVARTMWWTEVEDAALARRLAQGDPLPDPPAQPCFAAFHDGRLVGIYTRDVDAPGPARPQLVWTRPEELPS